MTTIDDVRRAIRTAADTVSSEGELAGVITATEARAIISHASSSLEVSPLSLRSIERAFSEAGLGALFARAQADGPAAAGPTAATMPDSAASVETLRNSGQMQAAAEMLTRLAGAASTPSARADLLRQAAEAFTTAGRTDRAASTRLLRADALREAGSSEAHAAYRVAGDALLAEYNRGNTDLGADAIRAYVASGHGRITTTTTGAGAERRVRYGLTVDGNERMVLDATRGEATESRAARSDPDVSSSLARRRVTEHFGTRYEYGTYSDAPNVGGALYRVAMAIAENDPAGAASLLGRARELSHDYDDHHGRGTGITESPAALDARIAVLDARGRGAPLPPTDPRVATETIGRTRAVTYHSPPAPTVDAEGHPHLATSDSITSAFRAAETAARATPRPTAEALSPVYSELATAVVDRANAVAADTSMSIDQRLTYLSALGETVSAVSPTGVAIRLAALRLRAEQAATLTGNAQARALEGIGREAAALAPLVTSGETIRSIVAPLITTASSHTSLPRHPSDTARDEAITWTTALGELNRAVGLSFPSETAPEARRAWRAVGEAYEHAAELHRSDDTEGRAAAIDEAAQAYAHADETPERAHRLSARAAGLYERAAADLSRSGVRSPYDTAQLLNHAAMARARADDTTHARTDGDASVRDFGRDVRSELATIPGVTVPAITDARGRVMPTDIREVERQILAAEGVSPLAMTQAGLTSARDAMLRRARAGGPDADLASAAATRYTILADMARLGVTPMENPPSAAQLRDYGTRLAREAYARSPTPRPQEVLDLVGARTAEIGAAFFTHSESAGVGGDVDYHAGADTHSGADATGHVLGDCQTFAFDVSRHMLSGALAEPDGSGRSLEALGYRLGSVIRAPEAHVGEAHVIAAVFSPSGDPLSVMSNDTYYSTTAGTNPLEAAFADVRLPRGTAARDSYHAMFEPAGAAIGTHPVTLAPELSPPSP